MLSLDEEIVLALRRISQAIDVWSRQLWHDYGLTSPQLATLREILAGKNVSPVTLAAALHLSQPTVTGILGRLEQGGLIRREPSLTDRRSILAVATDKGRELAAQAPPLLRDRFRNELEKTPIWQQTEILAVLQRVAAMMHAPEIAEAPFLFNDNDEVTIKDGASSAKRRRKTSNSVTAARPLAPETTQPGNKKRSARGTKKTE
jgi:DNA-binding MarR family transcriptional regulator